MCVFFLLRCFLLRWTALRQLLVFASLSGCTLPAYQGVLYIYILWNSYYVYNYMYMYSYIYIYIYIYTYLETVQYLPGSEASKLSRL